MNGEKLLKLSTVAERLDMSVRTVRKYVREGAIPVVRVGPFKHLRIRGSDVDRFSKDEKNDKSE